VTKKDLSFSGILRGGRFDLGFENRKAVVGERLGEGENNKTVELIVNSAMIITNNIPRLNACCMYSECLPPLPPPLPSMCISREKTKD
jgi:hypothetical protein